MPALRPALALLLAATVLTACESREEKAERFYQSALTLLEAGDVDRALVELRNVFDNDGFHQEARQLYADLLLERGDVQEAYGQLLRLVEQHPEAAEARIELAEVAIDRGEWDEAERHGREAIRLAPDNPRARAVDLGLRFRDAVTAGDMAAREEIGREARFLLTENPDLLVARRIVIDILATGPTPAEALPEVDRLLESDPDNLEFQIVKLRVLQRLGEAGPVGDQLRAMYELFPDNEDVRQSLVGFYISQGDDAAALALLQELAGPDDGDTAGHLTVAQFLQQSEGADAAIAELDRLAEANAGTANGQLYRAMRAGLDYEAGRTDEAVATLEEILAGAEPSDQTRSIKVDLARMLSGTGDAVGARSRVEEVIAEDPTNVDALKLRAAWAIQDDRPGDAILDLRAALSQDSRDVDALTLLAEAHERDGSPELAGERLASAVEVSGNAVEPSLRYAAFLQAQGRGDVAESVLLDARTAFPGDPRVHVALGEQWLQSGQPDRVEEAADALDAIGTPDATQAADTLRASALLARGRTDDGLGLLQALAAEDGGSAAVARVLGALLQDERTAEARAYLDDELARRPDDPDLRLMDASLRAVMGDAEGAEAGYRALMAEDPSREGPVRLLYGLLAGQGRAADAAAVLEAGLAAQPESRLLRLLRAAEMEQAGDIDGAIALHEALYQENSGDVVVANNLASLLASHKADDPEALARALAIARRLRDTEVPAFQDTYGWILHLQGESGEALAYLEPAAAGLPEDPLVQLHLGLALAAAGRTEDAVRQIEAALALAGDSPLPQFAEGRATLEALRAGGSEGPDGGAAETPAPAETPEAAPAEVDAGEAGNAGTGDAAPVAEPAP